MNGASFKRLLGPKSLVTAGSWEKRKKKSKQKIGVTFQGTAISRFSSLFQENEGSPMKKLWFLMNVMPPQNTFWPPKQRKYLGLYGQIVVCHWIEAILEVSSLHLGKDGCVNRDSPDLRQYLIVAISVAVYRKECSQSSKQRKGTWRIFFWFRLLIWTLWNSTKQNAKNYSKKSRRKPMNNELSFWSFFLEKHRNKIAVVYGAGI